MSSTWNGREIEPEFSNVIAVSRRPVAVTFLDTPAAGVQRCAGSEPSGCSFWRPAATSRTFSTVPENHFNCAVGAYTHHIVLSPDRDKETEQTLEMMFDLGPKAVLRRPNQDPVPSRSRPLTGE